MKDLINEEVNKTEPITDAAARKKSEEYSADSIQVLEGLRREHASQDVLGSRRVVQVGCGQAERDIELGKLLRVS